METIVSHERRCARPGRRPRVACRSCRRGRCRRVAAHSARPSPRARNGRGGIGWPRFGNCFTRNSQADAPPWRTQDLFQWNGPASLHCRDGGFPFRYGSSGVVWCCAVAPATAPPVLERISHASPPRSAPGPSPGRGRPATPRAGSLRIARRTRPDARTAPRDGSRWSSARAPTASGELPTAVNDAGLVAQALTSAGFEVVQGRDLGANDLRQLVRDFLDRVNEATPTAPTPPSSSTCPATRSRSRATTTSCRSMPASSATATCRSRASASPT